MKKLICTLMMLSLFMLGILTIPASAFGSSYVGLGIFSGSVDYADKKIGMFDDIRPHGGVVRLGTYLTSTIALEARYMDASGEESASDGGGSKTDFDFHAFSGLIKADLPKTGKAQLYGLLGWSSVHVKAASLSNRHNGVAYGGGVEVGVTKSTTLNVEYNHIVNEELLDVAGFTILFSGKF